MLVKKRPKIGSHIKNATSFISNEMDSKRSGPIYFPFATIDDEKERVCENGREILKYLYLIGECR